MQFPFHTQSKPVVGREAKRLLSAVESGSAVTNNAAQETFRRIMRKRARRVNGEETV